MTESTPNSKSKRSPLRLLWGILTQPRDTLAYLSEHGRRTAWLPALLILFLIILPMVVSSAVAGRAARQVMPPMAGPTPVVSGGPPVMPMEEREMVAPQARGLGPIAIIGSVLGTAISWLIWAGALYLASVFVGRSTNFRQMFRLTVWTWIPHAVRGLVQTVYTLISSSLIVNAGLSGFAWDRSASATQLVPPSPGQIALASLLARVDLYFIWHLILVVLGIMAFNKLSRKKALIATLSVWAVLTLLGMIPALLGGVMTQFGAIFQ